MTIYIDTLFVLNLIINYILLLGAAKLSGTPFRRIRLLGGAALGALYAVAVFFPKTGFLLTFAAKLAIAVLIILVSFKIDSYKRLVRLTLTFWGVSFILGGGVYAVFLMTKAKSAAFHNGTPYIHIDLKVLILSAVLCYGLLSLVFKRRAAEAPRVVIISITHRGRNASFNALIDTGHSLQDPFTNDPVIVADRSSVKSALPVSLLSILDDESLKNPTKTLGLLSLFEEARSFRLVPYNAIGVNSGLLLAFKPDKAYVDKKYKPDVLIALSPTPISDGLTYSALAGV